MPDLTESRGASHAELAQALAARSDWAASETWYRFAPAVINLAKRTLGSKWEAEDAAQEVFYRVFVKADTLRDAEKLPGFIFALTDRVLKSAIRRKKTRAPLSFNPPETSVDLRFELMDMESRDLLRRFCALLERLAPRHRRVFVLRHIEAMKLDEVAVQIGLSIPTVKRALDRAWSKLRLWLEADPGLAASLDPGRWHRQPPRGDGRDAGPGVPD